jgi:hypothetical protein
VSVSGINERRTRSITDREEVTPVRTAPPVSQSVSPPPAPATTPPAQTIVASPPTVYKPAASTTQIVAPPPAPPPAPQISIPLPPPPPPPPHRFTSSRTVRAGASARFHMTEEERNCLIGDCG